MSTPSRTRTLLVANTPRLRDARRRLCPVRQSDRIPRPAAFAFFPFLLWIAFGLHIVPGYITYKRRTLNLEAKVNQQWSQELALPAASPSNPCSGAAAIMATGLLCSNHGTYRFGKGMIPKAYRLSREAMAVIMEQYASICVELGDEHRKHPLLSPFHHDSAFPLHSDHSALHQAYLGLSEACLPAPQALNTPLVLKFTGAPPPGPPACTRAPTPCIPEPMALCHIKYCPHVLPKFLGPAGRTRLLQPFLHTAPRTACHRPPAPTSTLSTVLHP
ncbi:hypothetical protein B0H16DRAFT_1745351 [Mycena metata]|uniref:Uncharacterized protein n=1 Tax=Mycena metata TaxID=1033252 RepID=A0AAD7H340_9AGAR|nr:hypothetical protein B0H16DRAFT_1745351 [Mycena metata]